MSSAQQIALGETGLSYLKEMLRGWGGLSDLLHAQLDAGEAFGLMPPGTSLARALEFEAGGLLSMGEGQDYLFAYLQKITSARDDGNIVLQDFAARFDDPLTESDPTPKFFCGRNLYYYVEKRKLTAIWFHEALRSVASFHLIGAFASKVSITAAVQPDGSVDPTFLSDFAKSAEVIFSRAYDQESFVVWSRASRELFN